MEGPAVPIARIGAWIRRLLQAYIVIAFIHLCWMFVALWWSAVPEWVEGELSVSLSVASFLEVYVPLWPVTLVMGGIGAATAGAWLLWQDRAHGNVLALGGSTTDPRRPGFRWWFVPVANLWYPYRIVRDLNDQGGRLTRSAVTPGAVQWWWVVWVLGATALVLTGAASVGAGERVSADEAVWLARGWVATDALLLVAAAIAFLVVGRITSSLEFAREHPAHSGAPAVPPG